MGDMIVNHQEQPPADPRIVVGVDGSQSSLQALERAARYAELTGAALEVITTWALPVTYGWSPQVPADWDPLTDVTKELDKIVAQLRQAHPDVTVHPRVVEGHAAPVLIEAARGAELLVVGSRGHGEFTGMLLGSVGAHCVSHAHCPVLIERGDV
jgi:nucleotide-binding universal stress UspA family protein